MDSSDESDMDDDLDQPAVVKTKHHDLMMKGEGSRKGSFFKQAKKSYPMFPTHEERIKWDEYGEIIRYREMDVDMGSLTPDVYELAVSPLTNMFFSQVRRLSCSRTASHRGGEEQIGVRDDQW